MSGVTNGLSTFKRSSFRSHILNNLPHTQQKIAELDTELLVGPLSEQRYDEIMAILLPHTAISDDKLTLICSGKKEWREKHLKALNFQVFP
jgi:hypothetical protein